jgi:hypothetical protein
MSATLRYLNDHVIPTALTFLPPSLTSIHARAQLLAIALQESDGEHRTQMKGGPARGFWQFEQGTPKSRGGITGVLLHKVTNPLIEQALLTLQYPANAAVCHEAVMHNDVLAAIFARLLLYTSPLRLPAARHEVDLGWSLYASTWNPGKPHPEKWPMSFDRAWEIVLVE